MGQLLVVKYFKLASNYQRPELIPDPLVAIVHYAEPMDLGSVGGCAIEMP
jgi:hypothetical protein